MRSPDNNIYKAARDDDHFYDFMAVNLLFHSFIGERGRAQVILRHVRRRGHARP